MIWAVFNYYRVNYRVKCCFKVVWKYTSHSVLYYFICTMREAQMLFSPFLIWYFLNRHCDNITYVQEGNSSQPLCNNSNDKKIKVFPNCYNRAFIFHPIIGESIWDSERSPHERTVSSLQVLGTDGLHSPVCLSVSQSVSTDKRGDAFIKNITATERRVSFERRA